MLAYSNHYFHQIDQILREPKVNSIMFSFSLTRDVSFEDILLCQLLRPFVELTVLLEDGDKVAL